MCTLTLHIASGIITYPCHDLSQTMFAKEAPGYIDCCRHATAYAIDFVWHMHIIKYCDYAKLGRSLRTRYRHKAILIYKLWNYKLIFPKHIAQRAHIAGKLFLFITKLFNKSNFRYMFRIFIFFSLKHKAFLINRKTRNITCRIIFNGHILRSPK